MNRTVQQITKQLIDLLPENDQYYRLDELRSWGFPVFVVKRIRIELERNLAESMIIPKTDWANIQSDAVQNAWQQFVDAIRAGARLPASYAKAVIETAVADVVDMLVQPRKNIPAIIFGPDEKLDYLQLTNRLEAVVVYPHFANLLSRYMQKKDLETLSRQQCADIIEKADKKITGKYSPLNWAQMLDPLFNLLNGTIDTNLLRLFYEDKDMPRIARRLDLMDDSLSRARLIEVLSSPELLNLEGYEDEQANLFEVKPHSAQEEHPDELYEPETEPQTVDSDHPEDENGEAEKRNRETEEEDDSLNAGYAEKEEPEEGAEQDEDNSLNAVFTPPDDEKVEETTMALEESDEGTEFQAFSEEEPPEDERTEDETAEANPEEQELEKETAGVDSELDKGDSESESRETPMWMRFMSDEEVADYKRRQEEELSVESEEIEDEEKVDEDGFIDDPIIDLTEEEDASEQEIDMLDKQLSDERELFVEEIFRGSDRAFDEAVEEIAAYDNWRDVSRFIEKDVFKRNLVDMYSEPAVDFTDRLQSYFLEKQNRNS
jgi:hypothetical protein